MLIHAAAGEVGFLLVQGAKHLGSMVIGRVSTEEKACAAKYAGADHAIFATKQDYVNKIKHLTNGRGAELILDGVENSTFQGSLETVAIHGHVVNFGSTIGPADPIMSDVLRIRSITVSGGSLINFIATRKDLLRPANDVLNAIHVGWLKLRIDHVLPLAEVKKAH